MPDDGPPPGGRHPGRPPEPWPGGQSHDPDEQPTQQWVRPDSWDEIPPQLSYGQPVSEYPRYLQSPHEPPYGEYQGAYPSPQPHEPGHGAQRPGRSGPLTRPATGRSSRRPVLALAVVLAFVVLGSSGTALYLLGQGDDPQPAQRSAKPPLPSAGTPDTTPRTPGSTPAPQSSTDARFVKVGQCVKNEGAGGKPRLVITRCTARTYQVLARFDGATTGESDAKAKCGKVAGYTDWFFFNSELDVLDYVLCLKLR
jgi:hypothetical protein